MAAAASRLLDLDAKQAAHAQALSLVQSPPGVGAHNAETSSRWIAIGAAARNGWLAAKAAQAGFTSDTALFEGKFFSSVYGIEPKAAALSAGLS